MSTAAWLDDPRPEVQAYVRKIKPRLNGQLPPYSGPRAYDIVYSFKYCFEKSGITNKPADLDSDRDKIRRVPWHAQGLSGRRRTDHHG